MWAFSFIFYVNCNREVLNSYVVVIYKLSSDCVEPRTDYTSGEQSGNVIVEMFKRPIRKD